MVHRREQVQKLLIRGLSAEEMARSIDPPVSERTIRRDVTWIRRENEKWWRNNSQLQARMVRYMKESIDAMAELAREGWLIAFEAKDDLKLRVSGLNVALGARKAIAELLGFSGVTMLSLEMQEKFEVVDRELKELKELAKSKKAAA